MAKGTGRSRNAGAGRTGQASGAVGASRRAVPAGATRPRAWWVAVLFSATALLVYGPSLAVPFVFDDNGTVIGNPYLTRLWPLSEAMRAPLQSAFSGRPLASLTLALSYATGDGLSPSAFRLWNLAFLVASALVLFGLIRRTLARVAAARGEREWSLILPIAGAGLWMLHPLQTEVVGYITQRTESLMGLFYLLTLYASVRALPATEWSPEPAGDGHAAAPVSALPLHAGWSAVAAVSCALGMLCKESMVTAPVMVMVYHAVFGGQPLGTTLRRGRWLYAGLAAGWLVLALANLDAPRFRSAGFTAGVSPWTYLLNQGPIIATYLKLSVWPHPLIIDYGLTGPIALTAAWPGLLLVVALLLATGWAWFNGHRVAAFLGTWFFVTLAPTSSVVPIATEVGAERRMFLPLAAVVLLAMLGAWAAARRWAEGSPLRQPRAGAVIVAVLALLFGGLSAVRMRAYADPVALWQGVLTERPHGRAYYNLGFSLKEAGRTADAIAAYRSALPEAPEAHYALGFELWQAGQAAEAASEFRAFLAARPHDVQAPKAAFLLGQALASQGRTSEAEQAFRDTLRMVPGDADARLGLADLYLSDQRLSDAVTLYREYLERVPNNPAAHHNLGMALIGLQREAEAVPAFERAVVLKPADANLQLSLGQALATAGRLDDAVDHLREAVKLAPNNPRAMSALALTLAAGGEVNAPLDLFRRARQLAPNDPAVQADYDLAVARWRGQHQ